MLELLLILGAAAPVGGSSAPVPFTTIAEGQQSGIEERREVVARTAEEWKAVWQQHAPDRPLPKVDFARHIVIGVFLGTRNTGGYRVTIAAIERQGTDVLVTWREEAPPAGAIVTQMLSFPFHLVRVERVAGRIKFAGSD